MRVYAGVCSHASPGGAASVGSAALTPRRPMTPPAALASTVPGSAASDRAALWLAAAWAAATATLLAVPAGPVGVRVLAAVAAWHVAVLVGLAVRRDAAWRSAYGLVAPMSVLLVLPDQFIAVLGTIVFPDTGAPFVGRIPLFMAGMWAIPLAAVVLAGRAGERRGGPRAGVAAGTLLGLAVFVGAEATSGVLPLWHAVGVPMAGPLAPYVLPAEAVLCATTVLADQHVRGRPVAVAVLAGALVVQAYTGGLALGWLLLGR